MQLAELRIKHFRCILDQQIPLDRLIAIVGPNGAGKSTALRAIREFYSTTRTISTEDFYHRSTATPIEISLTFNKLTASERGLFSAYLSNDALVVTKIITASSEKYHGSKFQHGEFAKVRQLSGKRERLDAYRELIKTAPYNSTMQKAASSDAAEIEMLKWEREHPTDCTLEQDDGQFFGFRQVGQARLERFTRFVLVPAVHDAEADAVDRKGSAIYELMELVVRSSITKNAELAAFKSRTQSEYSSLIGPATLPELNSLSAQLSNILKSYVPTANVLIDWEAADDIELPMPKGKVRLEEDNFSTTVDRVGHGLQRAFILSLLQMLASNTRQVGNEELPPTDLEAPDLILAIEEPELFQHPNRQRHLANVLSQLSKGELPGAARQTQVVYCTHSPLFVDLALFDSVRRFTKHANPVGSELPHISSCSQATIDSVAEKLHAAVRPIPEKKFTREGLLSRMRHLMGPFASEGFFADVAIVVEGEEDRAMILGCAKHFGYDLAALGIAVLPVGGKGNLDKPSTIFRSLGIPTIVVFDSDSDKKGSSDAHPETNQLLMRLAGVEDPQEFPETQINEGFAVFSPNLTKYLKALAGTAYETIVQQHVRDFGYDGESACRKSPYFVQAVVSAIGAANGDLSILKLLVERAIESKSGTS